MARFVIKTLHRRVVVDMSSTQCCTFKSNMSRVLSAVLLLALYISSSLAFAPTMNRWVQRAPPLLRTNIATKGSKPDLFSDDLFGDDQEVVSKKGTTTPIKATATYLDENWKLSSADQKEFKGFAKKEDIVDVSDDHEPEAYPCFALMYKLRREYMDTTIESALADHHYHCGKFKRLINSEVIALKKSKGLVLLWAGLSADDKDATKAEIKEFMEDDPLITKDMIEKWDIIDLEKKEDRAKESPKVVSSSATTAQ